MCSFEIKAFILKSRTWRGDNICLSSENAVKVKPLIPLSRAQIRSVELSGRWREEVGWKRKTDCVFPLK